MFLIAEVIWSKRGLDVNMIERKFGLDKIAVLHFFRYQVPLAKSLLQWQPLTHNFFQILGLSHFETLKEFQILKSLTFKIGSKFMGFWLNLPCSHKLKSTTWGQGSAKGWVFPGFGPGSGLRSGFQDPKKTRI